MKKFLLVAVMLVALVPASAFALKFQPYSGIVKKGVEITMISTDGTKLTSTKLKLVDGVDKAASAASTDANVKNFVDHITFKGTSIDVTGKLLVAGKKLTGPASFTISTPAKPAVGTQTVITGAANVDVVFNKKGTKATVEISFLPSSVAFNTFTGTATVIVSTKHNASAKIHVPVMKKAVLANRSALSLP